VYRYVRYSEGTTANNCHGGACLLFVGETPYTVTQDNSDTQPNAFAGIANTIMTNNQYGWIQCGGLVESIITGTDVEANGQIMASTTDGVVSSFTGDGEYVPIGIAISADSGSVSNFVYLYDR